MLAAIPDYTTTIDNGDVRPVVHFLDYGAGNVRSIRNAIHACGFDIRDVKSPADLEKADVLVFPGVGAFGSAMAFLETSGFKEALLTHIRKGKPYMGICLGMQTLFEASEEGAHAGLIKGLGLIPGVVERFPTSAHYSVPHIGWQTLTQYKPSPVMACPSGSASSHGSSGGSFLSSLGSLFSFGSKHAHDKAKEEEAAASAKLQEDDGAGRVYFVHSYRVKPNKENADWVAATCDYGREEGDGLPFIAAVAKGNLFATQFHPEKSGPIGLHIFKAFLTAAVRQVATAELSTVENVGAGAIRAFTIEQVMIGDVGDDLCLIPFGQTLATAEPRPRPRFYDIHDELAGKNKGKRPITVLAKRIVACLDVRSNDDGDLVVTKGDKYDVREKASSSSDETPSAATASTDVATKGNVRNLGKPVDLCARYYQEGADEIALLNITAFRSEPLEDAPLVAVLQAASEKVFVPLTIGGGIRAYTDSKGKSYSALDVAASYFRAGADKVSIGSDAVLMAEEYWQAKEGKADSSYDPKATAIGSISQVYGKQAVVVSIDPRRVYLKTKEEEEAAIKAGHTVVTLTDSRRHLKDDESATIKDKCWYECMIKGGREGRPICAQKLALAVEALGAGELLVNCVDEDGQKQGYDEDLLRSLKGCGVTIPMIASSGAGAKEHFSSVFMNTGVEAALAAGIFHRKEVRLQEDVKAHLGDMKLPVRR
jgi:imidazole glycerol-phosphate synthase